MGANNVYTAAYSFTLNAGLTFVSNFSIQSVGREIWIKSIAVDWNITDTITGIKIPWRTVTDQILTLIVGNFGLNPQQIAKSFRQTGGVPPAFSGNTFRISEPQQLKFDSFFVSNELPLSLQINNLNAASDRDHNISILIETQEKTMFL